jgi:UDP-N-acetylglucosamine 2-epimerase (non-hydrolysing)
LDQSKKLAVVLGIRPDVIRASLMLRALKQELGSRLVFIWSGQHYSDNMKDIFFRQLGVSEPDITLKLDTSSDQAMIGSLIHELGDVLAKVRPDAVVFLGDTNTVTGSIAAAALDIPIVHIEGCMRSYDWRMPEEKYRTTIDHLSDLIYAYLPEYKEQGMIEGLDPDRIVVTGNPIVDVLEHYFISGKVRLEESQRAQLFSSLGVSHKDFWLMTCHRRENIETIQSLLNIFRLAESVGEEVVFAAGYRTQRQIKELGIELPRNVNMIDPIGYVELMELAVESVGILTDSGTLVEEAAVLKVPSVQMRTSTERPQVYDTGGCVKFDPLGTHSDEDLAKLVFEVRNRRHTAGDHNLGVGKASEIIVQDLLARLKVGNFRGHKESDVRRPIARNYGAGVGNRGQV